MGFNVGGGVLFFLLLLFFPPFLSYIQVLGANTIKPSCVY